MPQSQTPANPRHQEEEKNDGSIHAQNKQTVREEQRPAPISFPVHLYFDKILMTNAGGQFLVHLAKCQ